MNQYEENLRRLTFIKAYLRKEIDTTWNMQKKEELRKKHEKVSKELEEQLKRLKIEAN